MITLVTSVIGFLVICITLAALTTLGLVSAYERANRWWRDRQATAVYRRAVREFIAEERQKEVAG